MADPHTTLAVDLAAALTRERELRDALHGWQGFYHGGYLVGIKHEDTASVLARQGEAALNSVPASEEEA